MKRTYVGKFYFGNSHTSQFWCVRSESYFINLVTFQNGLDRTTWLLGTKIARWRRWRVKMMTTKWGTRPLPLPFRRQWKVASECCSCSGGGELVIAVWGQQWDNDQSKWSRGENSC